LDHPFIHISAWLIGLVRVSLSINLKSGVRYRNNLPSCQELVDGSLWGMHRVPIWTLNEPWFVTGNSSECED